jgi:hypothetical protein
LKAIVKQRSAKSDGDWMKALFKEDAAEARGLGAELSVTYGSVGDILQSLLIR